MKEFIKNREGKKVCVEINLHENSRGIVFVMHGLGGFKTQDHIQTFAKAFYDKGFTTILFDTTNTLGGESEGNYEDATLTNYYSDLEDVISWASNQEWYKEPFYLAGHSLGGISTALFAEKHPQKVKGVAPISPVVSGELSLEAHSKEELDNWKSSGWLIKESTSLPGTMKKLKWSHMEDRVKYNLLSNVDKLTMPVLIIVGEKDTSTPLSHQEIFYEALTCDKELHVINGAMHTFREKKHLDEIYSIMSKWIDKVEN